MRNAFRRDRGDCCEWQMRGAGGEEPSVLVEVSFYELDYLGVIPGTERFWDLLTFIEI